MRTVGRADISTGFGAPAPGRPNGFQSGNFSAMIQEMIIHAFVLFFENQNLSQIINNYFVLVATVVVFFPLIVFSLDHDWHYLNRKMKSIDEFLMFCFV